MLNTAIRQTISNDIKGDIGRWQHGEHHHCDDVFPYFGKACLVHFGLGRELHQTNTQESGKTDEYGVDKEQIERTEEEGGLPRGQSVARRA